MTPHPRFHHCFSLLVIVILTMGAILSPAPARAATELADLVGTSKPAAVAAVDKERVRKVISGLDTERRTSRGTYDRVEQYGEWSSNEGSADETFCGSTREDIRHRDLSEVQLKPGDECAVQSGVLEYDPYTGNTVEFARTANPDLEVEHIVPVELHYDMMGYGLTQAEREEFNNDPENLILVDGSANGSKGSAGPAEWLVPDNPAYACTYIARFSYVADKYSMPVDPADKKAMLKGLDECDNTASAEGASSGTDNPLETMLQDRPVIAALLLIAVIAVLIGMTQRKRGRGRKRSRGRAMRKIRQIERDARRWGL